MLHRPTIIHALRRRRQRAIALAALAALGVAALAAAQQQRAPRVSSSAEQAAAQRITPNFKDADITQIIEAGSMAVGKNFIIDPRGRAQVTTPPPPPPV